MSTCPRCGAAVPTDAGYCGNCEAAINNTSKSDSTPQPKISAQEPTASSSASSGDLTARLEKAMRRNELLTCAAAGLGVALLAVIVIISLL